MEQAESKANQLTPPLFWNDKERFCNNPAKQTSHAREAATMEIFTDFGTGIWEADVLTPERKLIKEIERSLKQKLQRTEEYYITEDTRKPALQLAPAIDGS